MSMLGVSPGGITMDRDNKDMSEWTDPIAAIVAAVMIVFTLGNGVYHLFKGLF